MEQWAPFISDCLALLDSDGAFHHWKYPGAYVDQPWLDQQIYSEIRMAWVKWKNDQQKQRSKIKTPSIRRPTFRRRGR